jgi:amino acid permease
MNPKLAKLVLYLKKNPAAIGPKSSKKKTWFSRISVPYVFGVVSVSMLFPSSRPVRLLVDHDQEIFGR